MNKSDYSVGHGVFVVPKPDRLSDKPMGEYWFVRKVGTKWVYVSRGSADLEHQWVKVDPTTGRDHTDSGAGYTVQCYEHEGTYLLKQRESAEWQALTNWFRQRWHCPADVKPEQVRAALKALGIEVPA